MIEKLVCPKCKNNLISKNTSLNCKTCESQWQSRRDIFNFSCKEDVQAEGSLMRDLKHFLISPKPDKCNELIFKINQNHVARGEPIIEDQRMADWCYLLPHKRKNNALILGSGMGIIAIVLSQFYENVYVIDPVWEKLAFLEQRKQSVGRSNIVCIQGDSISDLPFPRYYFDLINISDFMWSFSSDPLAENIMHVNELLRPDGVAFFGLKNRYSLLNIFDRQNSTGIISAQSMGRYKKTLGKCGFSVNTFYAPLPFYDGIPLFLLPLEGGNVIDYYFKSIFPLLEMVSPETKKDYAIQYSIIKVAVRFALIFKLTWLARYFVPGFSIIAQKIK
jgi:SAM-dependent methyltransferase